MSSRRATPDDVGSLANLHADAFSEPWPAQDFYDFLAQAGVFALMAGAPPEAFILCRAMAGEAEVLTLATSPKARRRGLARELVEGAKIEAARLGAETMFLEVAADNSAALGLYGAARFVQAGVRRGYYGRPQGACDALILRCALNSAPA